MGSEYRIIPHTADVGVEARASSLGSLIEALASAMADVSYEVDDTEPTVAMSFRIEAATPEDLVVDVLAALLTESETRDVVWTKVVLAVDPPAAADVASCGVPTALARPRGAPIKAVTYHDLKVVDDAGRWSARVIFDV